MIFGVPWQFWLVGIGVVVLAALLERLAVRHGVLRRAKDVNAGWAFARGRVMLFVVAVPIFVTWLVVSR